MMRTLRRRHLEQGGDLGPHEERVLAGRPERDLVRPRPGRRPCASPSRTGRRRGTCTRPRRRCRRARRPPRSRRGRCGSGSRRCRRARRQLAEAVEEARRAAGPRGAAARPAPAPRSSVPTTGSSSYSTSMRSRAAAAVASSSAATAATGSPAKRTRSMATIGRSLMAWPQYGSMSARSAPVRTRRRRASLAPRTCRWTTIRACATGLRRTLPWSMRGTTMSPANCAWPRSFSAASTRGIERPTCGVRRRPGDEAPRCAHAAAHARPARRQRRRCRGSPCSGRGCRRGRRWTAPRRSSARPSPGARRW